MHIYYYIISFMFVLMIPLCSFAQTYKEGFLEAKKALHNDDMERFFAIKAQMTEHPLYPYLKYYYIDKHFDSIDVNTLLAFLNKYPNSPMASKLYRKWLITLAENENWETFLRHYKPMHHDAAMQCYYLRALQQTGQDANIQSQVKAIWLVGRSQPDNCTPVFTTWLNASPKRTTLIWQRFELALKNHEFGLANYLAKKLPELKRNKANAILEIYSKPYLVTQETYLKQQLSPEVISYGLYRLANRDPNRAAKVWERLQNRYQFNEKQKQRIFQAIALRYGLRKNENSIIWFRKIIDAPLEPIYKEWMIRAGLYHNDWELVHDSITTLSEEQRNTTKWQYWYARALDQLGQKAKAKQILQNIAHERNYHGFLANKFLNKNITINNNSLTLSQQDVNTVLNLPALQRAKYLYQLNHKREAYLEIKYLMRQANSKQQYIILNEIASWNLKVVALRLSLNADYKDDITLRFPMLYTEQVSQNAHLRQLNPALIYALIRQESGFMAQANSHAGAVGLMQLMPATAQRTASQFRLNYSGRNDLLDSDTNIKLGCAHLQKLFKRFNGHKALVMAAYNAGSNAVNRWLPNDKEIAADIWIETIPFYETRKYLKRVIAAYIIYQYQLGQTPSLDKFMKDISITRPQASEIVS